jgi:hypothetical protein
MMFLPTAVRTNARVHNVCQLPYLHYSYMTCRSEFGLLIYRTDIKHGTGRVQSVQQPAGGMDDQRFVVRSPRRVLTLTSSAKSQQCLVRPTQASATGSSFTAVREIEHIRPSNADVKNEWSHASTSPYAFGECTEKNVLLLYLQSYDSKLKT